MTSAAPTSDPDLPAPVALASVPAVADVNQGHELFLQNGDTPPTTAPGSPDAGTPTSPPTLAPPLATSEKVFRIPANAEVPCCEGIAGEDLSEKVIVMTF